MTSDPRPAIDRIAPTLRPAGSPIGFQRWRSLLFLHWAVPADALRPVVPESLELDLHNGQAYVGVVPFVMRGVRPWWSPEPLAFNFLETNVRTYVTHRGQPGVLFFSLEASSRIAVAAARRFWGLPYFNARMWMNVSADSITYATERKPLGARHEVRYRIGPPLAPSEPGSLQFFLLERYLLFVPRGTQLSVGQVHHAPYPVHTATVEHVADELIAAAGLPAAHSPPDFVHYSPGVDVEIFPLRSVNTA